MKYNNAAVTLIELVVTIAIIAVIAAVGYPNYNTMKMESKRADARSALLTDESNIERHLVENNKANIDSSDMALSQFANYAVGSGTPKFSRDGLYRITIVPDSTGYTLSATAVDGNSLTSCNSSTAKQCADTVCREIYIYHGEQRSKNSAGVVANASTTTCW